MAVMARELEEFIVRKKMMSKHVKKEEEEDGQRAGMVVYCTVYSEQLRTKKAIVVENIKVLDQVQKFVVGQIAATKEEDNQLP